MKVYAVTVPDFDADMIVCVFSSRALAEAFVAWAQDGNVEEWDLDPECAMRAMARGWKRYRVNITIDGVVMADLSPGVRVEPDLWLMRDGRGYGFVVAGDEAQAINIAKDWWAAEKAKVATPADDAPQAKGAR